MDPFQFLLFLHILGAIIAFGPGFASAVVGPMVAKEPQHANFYARTQMAASKKVITPLAHSMLLTGIGMILVRGWGNIVAGKHWLELAIALYLVALGIAMFYLAPAGRKLVELTSTPPAPGSGPNPEIPVTARKTRIGGTVLTVLVVVISFLMVMKPF